MADLIHFTPVETLINVGWVTKLVGVIKLDIESIGATEFPRFIVRELPGSTSEFEPFGVDGVKVRSGTLAAPAIVNPITQTMLSRLVVWDWPAVKVGPNVDHVAIGTALLFINLGRAVGLTLSQHPTATEIKLCEIVAPAGHNVTVSKTLYWLWDSTFGATSLEENAAHPFITGDPLISSFATMGVPRPFETSAERDAYLTLGVSTWHGANTTQTETFGNKATWSLEARTFQKKLNFNETGANDITIGNMSFALSGDEKQLDQKNAADQHPELVAQQIIVVTLILEGFKLRVDVS